MANRITEKCTGCGACERECPNGAISLVPGAKKRYVIDPGKCDECVENEGKSACKAVCAEKCIVKAA